MHPTYYRGCWHVVSRCFLSGYRQISSPVTAVYNPKAFILHAALLRQAFAHCGRFSTAASRRSLGSVSVPVWVIVLSDHLTVVALVSRYLTNKLMVREPIRKRKTLVNQSCDKLTTSGINPGFPGLSPTFGQVAHGLLTLAPLSTPASWSFSFDLHA